MRSALFMSFNRFHNYLDNNRIPIGSYRYTGYPAAVAYINQAVLANEVNREEEKIWQHPEKYWAAMHEALHIWAVGGRG